MKYIELSKNINPVEFITEKDTLTEVIFSKLTKNKYENEVVFLTFFYPKIKDYFVADITAKNYYTFDELFNKFKKILLSYSVNAENTVSELDKYQQLLLKYHKNNLKRDAVFAQKLVKQKNNTNNLSVTDNVEALEYIKNNFNGKKVKLVVTGGFHTAGLEQTLTKNKISYIVITPKVTENIDKAKEIYTDTVKYNANILTNTINIEPVCQNFEIAICEVLNDIFYLIKNDETFNRLQRKDILSFLNDKFEGVEILNVDYSSIEDEQIKYTITYIFFPCLFCKKKRITGTKKSTIKRGCSKILLNNIPNLSNNDNSSIHRTSFH